MKLATIEIIKEVIRHPNADTLDIVTVLGYQAIVKRDEYKVGDQVVFIQPDTVLPDDASWAEFYKSKSKRVRAVKLRGSWSMGIVEKVSILPNSVACSVGLEVSGILGITKYEPPAPSDLSAKGNLPYGLFKTDEERYQNLDNIPFGEICDVTLKVDGSSMTVYCVKDMITGNWRTGICSRSLELKPECVNNYTRITNELSLEEKLLALCIAENKSLALRGEMYGQGIQAFRLNPHVKLPLGFMLFNVFDLETRHYHGPESNLSIHAVGSTLGIPTVPILEKDVILTPELIAKYDSVLTEINGQPFEGVVIKLKNGHSFKVINKHYDANK